MGIFTGIIVYLMLYWLSLFWVLPWGNKPIGTTEGGKAVASAPENPRILKKFLITAVLAAVLWLIVYYLIDVRMFDFQEMAQQMREEDLK